MGFWKDGDDYYKEFNDMWAKRCCETCKHRNDEDHGDISEQFCERYNWGTDSGIKIEKMKCEEWEAR